MDWADGFIAVDWGTTNRRAYLIDSAGACVRDIEDDRGAMAVPRGEFPAAVEELRKQLGTKPMLLAGMAGSTRGWMDAPYLPCPVGLRDLADNLVWAEPGRTAIVPGASYTTDETADIMRGEEVQVVGAAATAMIPPDCVVCHPGTHNKWVDVREGRIARFTSVMTGEMFSLLRERSILSEHLKQPVRDGDAFQAGVRRGLQQPLLTSELFSVRARSLLGTLDKGDAAAFTSGLLIGADVAAGLGTIGRASVFVMGSPKLTGLYAAALRAAGQEPQEIDGERAFIAGAVRIVELIA